MRRKRERTNHDRLFKELLTRFLVEFIQDFLPGVMAYLDTSSIEYLDKELFRDKVFGGRRETDVVARVKFKAEESYFLIHVENQSSSQTDFGERMFHYYARLHERYHKKIYPVAVFSHTTPTDLEPDLFRIAFPDKTVLEFHYTVIQLNRLDWHNFVNKPSPVTSALMSKMQVSLIDRPKVKAHCVAMLLGLKLDETGNTLISRFVETYLGLTKGQEKTVQAELDKLIPPDQKEEFMEVLNSWEKKGLRQGKREGLVEGKREGEATILIRQINRRFGQLTSDLETQVRDLPVTDLENLGDALFDFTSTADIVNWLEQHK